MASVKIHGPTGVLLVDGQKVFPIGISDPPPSNARAPSGEHAYQELANGGITMIRSGTPDWAPGKIDQQIARERELQISAASHGLQCWMRLGPVANLPGAAANKQLLQKIVTAFKSSPALCAYKGVDEPRNPFRGAKWIRPAGLVAAHARVKALDPTHPARDHPGAAQPGLAARALSPGVRHHGRRHLPDRVSTGSARRHGQRRHQRRRRHGREDEGGERRQARAG